MGKRLSIEEKAEKVREVKGLLEQGLTVKEAAEQAGVSYHSYGNWQTVVKKAGLLKAKTDASPLNIRATKNRPELVTIPLSGSDDRIFVLMGPISAVNQALDKLSQIIGG